jgi:hypothetical protein
MEKFLTTLHTVKIDTPTHCGMKSLLQHQRCRVPTLTSWVVTKYMQVNHSLNFFLTCHDDRPQQCQICLESSACPLVYLFTLLGISTRVRAFMLSDLWQFKLSAIDSLPIYIRPPRSRRYEACVVRCNIVLIRIFRTKQGF